MHGLEIRPAASFKLREHSWVLARCQCWVSKVSLPVHCCHRISSRPVYADAVNFLRRDGTESEVTRNDTLQSAVAAELHDNFECLRGVDPNGSSARLEHCPYSAHDFSAELPPTLQETGSRRLVNGGSGE